MMYLQAAVGELFQRKLRAIKEGVDTRCEREFNRLPHHDMMLRG